MGREGGLGMTNSKLDEMIDEVKVKWIDSTHPHCNKEQFTDELRKFAAEITKHLSPGWDNDQRSVDGANGWAKCWDKFKKNARSLGIEFEP